MSRVLFIPLIGLLCAACTDGTVLHCYKPLPREGWDRRDTVCFSLPKTESDLDGSLIVGLRTAAHVDFQDIVLAVECCDEETGLCRCDTVRYPLTDAEGFPVARGVNHHQYETQRLPFRQKKGSEGTVRIRHIMTREVMKGITEVGIRIETED